MRILFFLTYFFIVFSCNTPSNNIHINQPEYFNIKLFIANQSSLLSKNEISCLKNFTYNDQIEVLKIKKQDSTQWSKDFIWFINSDICQPKNKGLYRIDSLTSPKGKKHITYTALSRKLITQKFSVIYNKDKSIYMLNIKNNKENKLIKTRTELTFFPNKGFTMTTNEINKLGKPNQYECLSQFDWSGFEN